MGKLSLSMDFQFNKGGGLRPVYCHAIAANSLLGDK